MKNLAYLAYLTSSCGMNGTLSGKSPTTRPRHSIQTTATHKPTHQHTHPVAGSG